MQTPGLFRPEFQEYSPVLPPLPKGIIDDLVILLGEAVRFFAPPAITMAGITSGKQALQRPPLTGKIVRHLQRKHLLNDSFRTEIKLHDVGEQNDHGTAVADGVTRQQYQVRNGIGTDQCVLNHGPLLRLMGKFLHFLQDGEPVLVRSPVNHPQFR
jgi:hypothetical protein